MKPYTCTDLLESKRILDEIASPVFDLPYREAEIALSIINPIQYQLAARAQVALMGELALEYKYGDIGGSHGAFLQAIDDGVYEMLKGDIIPEEYCDSFETETYHGSSEDDDPLEE